MSDGPVLSDYYNQMSKAGELFSFVSHPSSSPLKVSSESEISNQVGKDILNEREKSIQQLNEALPIEEGNSTKSVNFHRLILLLISTIGILQDVTIAQVEHLSFHEKMQDAYMRLREKIPIFTRGDDTPLGKAPEGVDEKELAEERNNLNNGLNSTYIEKLKRYEATYEGEARKLQTHINHSEDSVKSTDDMLLAFLQKIESLLSRIH